MKNKVTHQKPQCRNLNFSFEMDTCLFMYRGIFRAHTYEWTARVFKFIYSGESIYTFHIHVLWDNLPFIPFDPPTMFVEWKIHLRFMEHRYSNNLPCSWMSRVVLFSHTCVNYQNLISKVGKTAFIRYSALDDYNTIRSCTAHGNFECICWNAVYYLNGYGKRHRCELLTLEKSIT